MPASATAQASAPSCRAQRGSVMPESPERRHYTDLTQIRATDPPAIARAWRHRQTRPTLRGDKLLLIVAADHPARGALSVGSRPSAMHSRYDLLDRLRTALANPRVDGVLATADILDDLDTSKESSHIAGRSRCLRQRAFCRRRLGATRGPGQLWLVRNAGVLEPSRCVRRFPWAGWCGGGRRAKRRERRGRERQRTGAERA